MRPITLSILVAAPLLLTGCQQQAVDATRCADICKGLEKPAPVAAPAAPALTAFEAGILSESLEDLRGGVRPFGENAIGVCKGSGKTCDAFLGENASELAPGDYMLRAELRVPKVGPRGTWKIELATQCKTTFTNDKGEVRTTESSRTRSYDVSYAGESQGYRLSPLMKIKSPSEAGLEQCTYTITAPHGDGDKVYTGSWAVPQG